MKQYNVVDEVNGYFVLFTGTEDECYAYINMFSGGNENLKVRPK
jgi:hypothetical protein